MPDLIEKYAYQLDRLTLAYLKAESPEFKALWKNKWVELVRTIALENDDSPTRLLN
jgi:hypothetical protein